MIKANVVSWREAARHLNALLICDIESKTRDAEKIGIRGPIIGDQEIILTAVVAGNDSVADACAD